MRKDQETNGSLGRWLTPQQAADYLQISLRSLQIMQSAGKIPFSRLSPKIVRYDRCMLDDWAASQQTNPAIKSPAENPGGVRLVAG